MSTVSGDQCEDRMTQLHRRLDSIVSEMADCRITLARIEERQMGHSGFIGHAITCVTSVISAWLLTHFGPGVRLLLLGLALLGLGAGCASTRTRQPLPGGGVRERVTYRLAGIPMLDSQRDTPSAAEAVAEAKAEAAAAAALAPVQRQATAGRALIWLGIGCCALAILSAVAAYLLSGWRLFGGAAAILLAGGIGALQMGLSVHRLWLIAAPIGAALVLATAYHGRHWSLSAWLAKRRV